MTKTLVITSGKGGVGKTNLAVNTGIELSRRGRKVCLFDADLGLANVNILLGIHPELTLDDYIFGKRPLGEIILSTVYGLDIIPGSSGTEKLANLNPEQIADLSYDFSQLEDYDYFLIDTASGISRGVISFCLASSETIVVINSEATSLTDAYALLKVLSSNGYKGCAKILVNRCSSATQSKEIYQRFKAAVDKHLNIKIAPAGMVVSDVSVTSAVGQRTPFIGLFPDSMASQCLRAVVSNLLKENAEDQNADFGEFWQRFFTFYTTDLALPESAIPEGTARKENVTDEPEGTDSTDIESESADVEPSPKDMEKVLSATPTFSGEYPAIEDPLSLATPIPLLSRVFELQSQAALSQEELLQIFGSDPALMAKAMQMVASSTTTGACRITNIEDIAIQLGSETLSSLLFFASMRKAFYVAPTDSQIFVNDLWYHSYKSGLIAKHLAELVEYPYPDEAYLAALLHDIGRLALQSTTPEVYAKAPNSFHDTQELQDLEISTFGASHAKIGADALRNWNLNNFLVDAVEFHSEQGERIETAFPLVKIVYASCRLSTVSKEEDLSEEEGKVSKLLDLSSKQLQECVSQADDKVQKMAEHYHIPLFEEKTHMESEKIQAIFRRQALDYSLLQGTLPPPSPVQNLKQILTNLHRSMDILFGIRKILCLLPDQAGTQLRATGYPNCFAWESLGDISLSLNSTKSIIVKTFSSGKVHLALEGVGEPLESLADEQIIRTLGSQGLASIPMVSNASVRGVIVFGIQELEYPSILESQSKLEQFGGQAARHIAACEQSELNEEVMDKENPGNLIQLHGTP